MAIREIPIRSDIPSYQFQITLEGVVYTMRFYFNTRLDRWIMDVSNVDGELIVAGIPLLVNLPLLDRFRDERLPPGRFILIDETGENRNPSRDSMGDDYKLLYQEAS